MIETNFQLANCSLCNITPYSDDDIVKRSKITAVLAVW